MRGDALLLVPAMALLLAACAGAPPAAPPVAPPVAPAPAPGAAAPAPPAPATGVAAVPPGAPPFSTLAARFTDRALRQEKAGDLHRALEFWKVVAALRPEAAEPRRRVADLGTRAAAEATRRYAAGIAKLEAGDVGAARRELLLALAADPGHGDALDALKNRLEPLAVSHTVAAGESFADIAKRYYGDETKAPLVARVNDLDPAERPSPGSAVLVPTIVPAPTKVAPAAKKGLPAAEAAEAPEAPETGYETEPAALAPDVPAVPPPPAPPVPSAPPAPPPPDPAEEQRRRNEKAEESYTEGVRFFINQQLEEAIRAWERTLALNPGHPKAPKDIEKARALQQKLRDVR